MTKQILILPGDGIGKEVTASAVEVLNYLIEAHNLDFQVLEKEVGGTSYDLHGKPLTDETLEIDKKIRCSIIWSSGRPAMGSSGLGCSARTGITRSQKITWFIANLRPAIFINELASAYPFKKSYY